MRDEERQADYYISNTRSECAQRVVYLSVNSQLGVVIEVVIVQEMKLLSYSELHGAPLRLWYQQRMVWCHVSKNGFIKSKYACCLFIALPTALSDSARCQKTATMFMKTQRLRG